MLTRFGLASNTLYALYLAIKNTGFKESWKEKNQTKISTFENETNNQMNVV